MFNHTTFPQILERTVKNIISFRHKSSMSPTDSEPMSGDELARDFASIGTTQVLYKDLYSMSDGLIME